MSARRFLVKYKGTSWSTVVLVLGAIGAVVALTLANKDAAVLIAFLTMLANMHINTARGDQSAADTTEVLGEVNGRMTQLVDAKTQPEVRAVIALPDPTAYQAVGSRVCGATDAPNPGACVLPAGHEHADWGSRWHETRSADGKSHLWPSA